MKKFISVFLTVVMIASMLSCTTLFAQAEDLAVDPTMWQISTNSEDLVRPGVKLSNTVASDGDMSLHITAFGAPVNKNVTYKQTGLGGVQDTYTVSVDVYGNPNTTLGMNLKMWNAAGNEFFAKEAKWWYGNATMSGSAGAGKWTTFSWEITDAPVTYQLEIFENTNEVYIDNLKLTNSSGTNILKNGSFENYPKDNTIAAYTLPEKWNLSRVNGNDDQMKTAFSVVNNVSTDGDNALQINHLGVLANIQYYLRPTVKSGSTAGTYTISLKINADPYNGLGSITKVYANGVEHNIGDVKWNGWTTKTDLGDGWYLLSEEFTTTGAITVVDFAMYENNKAYIIDEFSIKDSNGNEWIENGSFETIQRVNTLAKPTRARYVSYASMNANIDLDTVDSRITLANNKSTDGNNSLYVNWGVVSNQGVDLRFPVASSTGTSFTVSVDVYNIPNSEFGMHVYNGDTSIFGEFKWIYANSAVTRTDNPDGNSGWYRYTTTVTSIPSTLRVRIFESAKEHYVDNLAIYDNADSTKKNLVRNGSFEELAVAELPNNTLPANVSVTDSANSKDIAKDKVGNFFTLTTADSYDGNVALKAYNTAAWSYQTARCYVPLAETAPAGTYTLKFYANPVKSNSCVNVGVMGADPGSFGGWQYGGINTNYKTADFDYNWKEYTITGVNVEETASSVYFDMYEPADILIDKISFVDESGKEYMANGSFEEYVVRDTIITDVEGDVETGFTVQVANNNSDETLNVTLIAIINPLSDYTEILAKGLDYAELNKGEYDEIKVGPLSADTEEEVETRVFVWDGTNLTPYTDVASY